MLFFYFYNESDMSEAGIYIEKGFQAFRKQKNYYKYPVVVFA